MDKFEEQVCHNFDQFLPLNAVVKGKAAYKFIAYFLPYIIMSNR